MDKRILVAVLLSACLLASCAEQEGPPIPQTEDNEILSKLSSNTFGGLQLVELSPNVKSACAAATGKMKLMREVIQSKPANSMIEAQHLVWDHVNIANPTIPKACVECDGWFLFSRLDTAGPDDGTFKTGIAVKKGTTEIYKWK